MLSSQESEKELREREVCTEEAVVCLRKRKQASKSSYLQSLLHWSRSLGQSLAELEPSAAFSPFSQHCTFSAPLSHKSLRKPSLRGVFPFTYAVHMLTRTVSHFSVAYSVTVNTDPGTLGDECAWLETRGGPSLILTREGDV